MNKLQDVILMIATDVRDVFEKNNIAYSLSGGSLLGAVRHKGFIPWDDDFDFAVRRKDYKKAIKVLKKELDPDKYYIQTSENTDKYAFSIAKVLLNHTEIVESFSENTDTHKGVFVDIFVYDNIPDNAFVRKFFLIRNHMLKNLLWVKCGYGTKDGKKKLSYKIFKLLSYGYSIKGIKKKRHRLLNRYNDKQTVYCFSSDYPKNFLYNSWFEDEDTYTFENQLFKGHKQYDDYLTKIYGDYMKLPPEDQRRVHISQEVNFGPYA